MSPVLIFALIFSLLSNCAAFLHFRQKVSHQLLSLYPLQSSFGNEIRRVRSTQLFAETSPPEEKKSYNSIISAYYRSSWISWWIQIILSVISSVTLTFARQQAMRSFAIWTSGFGFSSVSVILAFFNAIWTWNITRLCVRINLGKVTEDKIISSLRWYSKFSVGISMVGILLSLLGAEQIVGSLAAKILNSPSYYGSFVPIAPPMGSPLPTAGFQPLDIFLVQANTNTLVSHFAPLIVYLLLQLQL
jgi:hypothetical protein